jgi:hypothetical protein
MNSNITNSRKFFWFVGGSDDEFHLVETCSLDNIEDESLDGAKVCLDNLITTYKKPLAPAVNSWFKSMDPNDGKSKLDACVNRLVLHQAEWEGINKIP